MRLFEVGKEYNETITTGRSYPVKCLKVTKCFVTFDDCGILKRYKISNCDKSKQTCYANCGIIAA